MRFLFVTLQTYESEFYGRVGAELESFGHEVRHLTASRQSARLLRSRGGTAVCLPDITAGVSPDELTFSSADALAARYGLPSIRDLYRTDVPCEGRSEDWCVRRSIVHLVALERFFDEADPDVLVPEVGSEMIRRAAHLVALRRGIPTLLLFYTIFPNPLRLYVDELHRPIVSNGELRRLEDFEREELEAFRRSFIARDQPIRRYRTVSLAPRRIGLLAGHVRAKLGEDRDNDYLWPSKLLKLDALALARRPAASTLYGERRRGRPFVYFPLHVTDDYKIKAVIPHCIDQASIAEQIADALPPGFDLVAKEHPMAIGHNPLRLLRRLRERPNVRLVHPKTSSHELIRESAAVAVISSTVGLEALLYRKPVLTLGEPFYAGYGVTLDLSSFAGIRAGVPDLLRFQPDPDQIDRLLHAAMRACRPGAPVLVDRSDENARTLAATLDEEAREAIESLAARGARRPA